MKKTFTILLSVAMLLGCSKYDDLESRVKALEEQNQEINANIESLQKIVNALQENITIKRVQKLSDGYVIHFSDGSTATIKNGDKSEVVSPLVTVQKDTDGIFYWTLNGKWLVDGAGKRINAQQNGGVVPMLKFQNEHWVISIDNGETWVPVSNATWGEVTNCIFKCVTEDDDNVYFTLDDNSVITIPKGDVTQFSINFDTTEIAVLAAGETQTLSYTITGATEKTIVKTVVQEGWKAKVNATSPSEGTIIIMAPDPIVGSEILVFANDGSFRTAMAVIDCQKGFITVVDDAYEIPADGGIQEVVVTSNITYDVEIPELDKSWISLVETRAGSDKILTFSIKPNKGVLRSTIVKLVNDNIVKTIGFTQDYPNDWGSVLATESDIVSLKEDVSGVLRNSLTIYGNTITSLASLDNKITRIAGNLTLDCSSLTSLDGLKGLTIISGDLIIKQGNFTDFEGLNNLQKVGGSIIITAPDEILKSALNSLESFEGLNNLQEIGGDFIVNCQPYADQSLLTSLKSFSGLTGLTKIGGDFVIESRGSLNALESFDGLNNLQEIGGDFAINALPRGSENPIKTALNSLTNLNGLSGLRTIGRGDIYIKYIPNLTDISGLGGVTSVMNDITIVVCQNLYNFNPLKSMVEKMTGEWEVSNCGYNPTKEQMLNGNGAPN